MDEASRRVLQLRPVTFHYKQPAPDRSKPLEYGLIAEEVAKVYPDLMLHNKDGQVETVQYHKLTPMLLNEVQRLNRAGLAQQDELKASQSKVSVLEARIREQDSVLQTQNQALAEMKQQISLVQAQARRMDAVAARLARVEAKPVGPIADARRP